MSHPGLHHTGNSAIGAGATDYATIASEEDSCPVGVACPTLTVGEVGSILSILEMDSYNNNIIEAAVL